MSFDLKIESNDLIIGSNGDLETVRDNSKLAQEVIKAVLTPLGSNRFFRWYGSTVSMRTIGKVQDSEFTQIETERAIRDSLYNIVSLQKSQARAQYVSPGETIASITDISVLRNPTEPRLYEVTISIVTRQLTEVEETFTLRV